MGGNKNQHNGRISSGQTAPPPSQGGVNVQPVNITRPPTYTLTVGFEVNYPTAFDGTTQNLGLEDPPNDKIGDYGHGFFYVTDSGNIIVTAISFGPDARATTKHISGQGRKGTINYRISEVTQLFRLTISERQCNNLKKAVAAFKKQVDNEEVLYDPFWNDTCAARARKVLDEAGIDTPSGEGYVKGTGSSLANSVAGTFKMVIPYMWHKNFVAKYGAGITFKGASNMALPDPDYTRYPTREIFLAAGDRWLVTPNTIDPLLSSVGGVPTRPHGDAQTKKDGNK